MVALFTEDELLAVVVGTTLRTNAGFETVLEADAGEDEMSVGTSGVAGALTKFSFWEKLPPPASKRLSKNCKSALVMARRHWRRG